MTRRLYFLLPDVERCEALVNDLEDHGIPERHMHVVASIEQTIEGLPEAGMLQKTELLHWMEIGLGLGGTAGLLGGLLVVSFPPSGLVIGGGALLATTVLGAGFGAVVSSLMKSHEHNHGVDHFEQAIEQGELLLLVDVPRDEVEAVKALIMGHHPEAEIGVFNPAQP